MEIDKKWRKGLQRPWFIAGPCSAESFEQLFETTRKVYQAGINVIRAGVWKPRTRPNSFEGVGEQGLQWMYRIKEELPVKFATEVATPRHLELALKYEVDMIWLGARTTVNPFIVQEIADALKGVDIPVFIKNPVNPDLALWMGCFERIAGAGINKIVAIHRGFSSFKRSSFRNEPLWQLAIELKRNLPELPLICDPSHIAGERTMIREVAQKALDLNYDGLMIETHPTPEKALSDPKQQVTPAQLTEIIENLTIRNDTCDNLSYASKLEELRNQVDSIDHDLVENLANRMKLIEEIGQYKNENDVTILQLERWKAILDSRKQWARALDMNMEFVEDIYKVIHAESIRKQTDIFND